MFALRSISNALRAAQFTLLRKPKKDITGRPHDVVVAIIIFVVCAILVNRSYFSGPVDFSLWGIQGFIASFAVSYLAITTAAIVLRRDRQLGATLVVFTTSMAVGTLLIGATWFLLKDKAIMQNAWLLFWVLGIGPVVAAQARFTSAPKWYHAWRGIVLATVWVLSATAFGHFYGQTYLFEAAYDEQAYVDDEQWSLPDPEIIYPAQLALLNQQTTSLGQTINDGPVMYALLGAGTPYQQIFQREIDHLERLLVSRFGIENRVITLGPTADDPLERPLLNRTNFAKSLDAISQAMDPSQDLVFVFLTSHGNPDMISTRFAGLSTRNLTSADVAQAIDESGITNAVIVVSACYSGSFVDDLAAPDRLILTAAAADRSSFGCAETNLHTDWGAAFFQALDQTLDFRDAAVQTQATVAIAEAERGYEPSLPQISQGAAIGPVLDAWLAAQQQR